ncbi:MAG: GntR family transcriptional regulator [Isosphaeraceae bacterium]|nr:GntR family transcriptional regulator [Isosphaeraceae bacterium]
MAEDKPSADGDPALAHVIYEGLRDEITGGKLRPGETLSRRGIARRYGTSSIPVIEALARLEGTGLVEAEARQAARVRKITIETIQDDYVLREAYETQAIRLACEHATPAEVDELGRMAETLDACVRVGTARKTMDKKGPRLHWQFHRQIARISRCRALARELERIELLRRLQANWYFAPEIPDPPRHHSLLVDAIRERNPSAADAVMRTHVRSGLEKELLAYRMKMEP